MNPLRYRFRILKALNPFARGARRYFVLLAALSASSVGISFVQPLFYRIFVDEVVIGRRIGMMPAVVAGYLGCFMAGILLGYLRIAGDNRLHRRTLFRMKRRLLDGYLAMPFDAIWRRSPGDLKMRIDDDMELFADFGNAQAIEYAKAMATAAVAAIVLAGINFGLAVFAVGVIPLTFFIDYLIGRKEKGLVATNRKNADSWQGWLLSSIQGWKTIKSLNLQRRQKAEFVSFAHNYALFFGRWINYWAARTVVIPRIKDEFLMKFAVYFLGGLLIMRGDLGIGGLLVFSMYFDLLGASIKTVSNCNADLRGNSPIYDRMLAELGSCEATRAPTVRPCAEHGSIAIRNLHFAYPDAEPLFKGFSADIKRGERVAIIGKSGVGKTTLVKLMSGMLRPGSGEILYNDTEVSTIDPRYLYDRIGVIMQENLLFNASIRENLLMAREDADERALERACKLACIGDFIATLPRGYDTEIGERGVKLSGGQKQRLVLARLLLRDVKVIIFDEATSALDQQAETGIFEAIDALGPETTCIVVAHRDSSIGKCDRRIVIS